MGILDTLEFLLGNWRVDRRIQDHILESDGHFQGTASISALEPLSEYDPPVRATMSESGELRFGAYNGTATRRLELSRFERFAVVSVAFSDGRPFVDLDLRKGIWQSWHVCGNDNYQIITTVLSDDSFEERWQVRGSKKRYDAVTNFVRY